MNKAIVVTGGTKGIGRAIVKKFAANNFDIITCSRNEEELSRLREEIGEMYPSVMVSTCRADLSIRKGVADFALYITTMRRTIDILVNNAGKFIQGALHQEEEGNLEMMINTNLYSAYHVSRAIIPAMIDQKHGYIFNICSTASIMPYVNGGSYCISKFAMFGMSKVLREEMKPFGIKVTSVLPGATKTASWDGVALPEERFVRPQDIADTLYAIYALSPNADVEEILIRPQLGDL
jgi:short-subunit dehydrogenase